jgi:hypothetical protein
MDQTYRTLRDTLALMATVPDMRTYMLSLISQTLRTPVREDPNWIRGVEGGRVRVATDGNEEGASASCRSPIRAKSGP